MKETSERTDELLDELYATLTRLCRFYEGMKRGLAQRDYTLEMAERDFSVLACNEGMSVLPILADLIDLLDAKQAQYQS
jgi:hypothetical protein